MSLFFEELQEGLLQAIDYVEGKGPARVTTCKMAPVIALDKEGICEIQNQIHMFSSISFE